MELDIVGFYRAIDATRLQRGLTWKEVAELTNTNASSLSRMGKGQKPDANSLSTLSAWAGLNPADFVLNMPTKSKTTQPDTLAQITQTLRSDSSLGHESITALEQMIRAAYLSMRKK